MKQVIKNIQNKLKEVPGVKYIDEDSGQLDYYSPNMPVMWPCVLIDLDQITYSDTGRNRRKQPPLRQQATGQVVITVANLKLTNSSGKATATQQQTALQIWDIIQGVHSALQGFRPTEYTGALIRETHNRVKRDDGIQEYRITYSIGFHDV